MYIYLYISTTNLPEGIRREEYTCGKFVISWEGGQFSSSSRSSSIEEGVENKVQSEINVCGKRSVEQMEDQNRMKRTGRFSGRYAEGEGMGGSWNKRKYVLRRMTSPQRAVLR